ncbi:hypothetical protein ACIBG8_19420 [Nonomuraea sp. NPDC050556]|uniref:hypothetical protein n=1 Tax=Nonomuraea sp. NPDC050556 TaxID=3364369 RepID=UPI003799B51C
MAWVTVTITLDESTYDELDRIIMQEAEIKMFESVDYAERRMPEKGEQAANTAGRLARAANQIRGAVSLARV